MSTQRIFRSAFAIATMAILIFSVLSVSVPSVHAQVSLAGFPGQFVGRSVVFSVGDSAPHGAWNIGAATADVLALADVSPAVTGVAASTVSKLDTEVMDYPSLAWKTGYTTQDVVSPGGPVVSLPHYKYNTAAAKVYWDVTSPEPWNIIYWDGSAWLTWGDAAGRHGFAVMIEDGTRRILLFGGWKAEGTRALGEFLKAAADPASPYYAQYQALLTGSGLVITFQTLPWLVGGAYTSGVANPITVPFGRMDIWAPGTADDYWYTALNPPNPASWPPGILGPYGVDRALITLTNTGNTKIFGVTATSPGPWSYAAGSTYDPLTGTWSRSLGDLDAGQQLTFDAVAGLYPDTGWALTRSWIRGPYDTLVATVNGLDAQTAYQAFVSTSFAQTSFTPTPIRTARTALTWDTDVVPLGGDGVLDTTGIFVGALPSGLTCFVGFIPEITFNTDLDGDGAVTTRTFAVVFDDSLGAGVFDRFWIDHDDDGSITDPGTVAVVLGAGLTNDNYGSIAFQNIALWYLYLDRTAPGGAPGDIGAATFANLNDIWTSPPNLATLLFNVDVEPVPAVPIAWTGIPGGRSPIAVSPYQQYNYYYALLDSYQSLPLPAPVSSFYAIFTDAFMGGMFTNTDPASIGALFDPGRDEVFIDFDLDGFYDVGECIFQGGTAGIQTLVGTPYLGPVSAQLGDDGVYESLYVDLDGDRQFETDAPAETVVAVAYTAFPLMAEPDVGNAVGLGGLNVAGSEMIRIGATGPAAVARTYMINWIGEIDLAWGTDTVDNDGDGYIDEADEGAITFSVWRLPLVPPVLLPDPTGALAPYNDASTALGGRLAGVRSTTGTVGYGELNEALDLVDFNGDGAIGAPGPWPFMITDVEEQQWRGDLSADPGPGDTLDSVVSVIMDLNVDTEWWTEFPVTNYLTDDFIFPWPGINTNQLYEIDPAFSYFSFVGAGALPSWLVDISEGRPAPSTNPPAPAPQIRDILGTSTQKIALTRDLVGIGQDYPTYSFWTGVMDIGSPWVPTWVPVPLALVDSVTNAVYDHSYIDADNDWLLWDEAVAARCGTNGLEIGQSVVGAGPDGIFGTLDDEPLQFYTVFDETAGSTLMGTTDLNNDADLLDTFVLFTNYAPPLGSIASERYYNSPDAFAPGNTILDNPIIVWAWPVGQVVSEFWWGILPEDFDGSGTLTAPDIDFNGDGDYTDVFDLISVCLPGTNNQDTGIPFVLGINPSVDNFNRAYFDLDDDGTLGDQSPMALNAQFSFGTSTVVWTVRVIQASPILPGIDLVIGLRAGTYPVDITISGLADLDGNGVGETPVSAVLHVIITRV